MARPRLSLVVALASVFGTGVVMPGAGLARSRPPAKIVVMKSIAGFSDGVTPEAVKRRLGRPSQTIRVSGRIAGLTYAADGLSFDFDTLRRSDPADDVTALSSRYRTSKGIHVGSSERAVKRAYHGLRCHNGLCDLYRGTPGAVGTVDTAFTFFAGKVDSIQIQKIFG